MPNQSLEQFKHPFNPNSAHVSNVRFSKLSSHLAKLWNGKKLLADFEHSSHSNKALSNEHAFLVQEGKIIVHLQPKYDVVAQSIIGFEALCRMQTPLGCLAPDQFIHLLDQRLAAELDWTMLRMAHLAASLMPHGSNSVISVNVSPKTVTNNGFSSKLALIAKECGSIMGAVKVEILENEPIIDRDAMRLAIEECRNNGSGVALDDFLTGHSNPDDLVEFKVDEVKIDRDLTLLLADKNPKARRAAEATILSIVAWAAQKNAKITAEGVETTLQAETLCALGANIQQGFLWGKPMPINQAIQLLLNPPLTPVILSKPGRRSKTRN